jgi:hypothetical protein
LELDTPIKRQKKAKIQELPNLLTSVFQPPAVPQSQLEMDTPIRRQKKAKIHDIPNLITTTFQVPANPPVNQEGYSFKFKQLKKIIWDIPNLLNTTLAVIVGSGVAPTVKFTFTLTRQLSFDFNLQSDPAVVFQLNRQLSYTKEMVSSNG